MNVDMDSVYLGMCLGFSFGTAVASIVVWWRADPTRWTREDQRRLTKEERRSIAEEMYGTEEV